MTAVAITDLPLLRLTEPDRVAAALATRSPGVLPGDGTPLVVVAADHPARGSLSASGRADAMADRPELLGRCVQALSRPGVNGFLGTADLIEDLALLGALEGKLVFGSMNRGGLAGASFEIDDRFTGYDAQGVADAGLDGGKMLLRIDPDDAGTVPTLQGCADAVTALARRRRVAMVEPFWMHRPDGRRTADLGTDAVIRSMAVAAGLGATSAWTWLKIPCVAQMERVAAASTLPTLLLGGDPGRDYHRELDRWAAAVALPGVMGVVAGRSLLYPADDDVDAGVDALVQALGGPR